MATDTAPLLDDLLAPELEERLMSLATEHKASYASADPFPHAVIDDFLPEPLLQRCRDAFPDPGALDWQTFDDQNQRKLAFQEVERLPATLRDMLYFLNSAPALRFLEELTGISALLPDPYFIGGGLHQILPGGLLKIHADFNKLTKLRIDRRINLLLFLNQDWDEDFGGHLELWDSEMTGPRKRVLPLFNRCVVFSTTDNSLHGHPSPLRCPEGQSRKSIATYYYTNGRPAEEDAPKHSTIFHRRPNSTEDAVTLSARMRNLAVGLTPPLVASAVRSVLRRREFSSKSGQ